MKTFAAQNFLNKSVRIIATCLLFSTTQLQAQTCFSFFFPFTTCSGTDCSVLISVTPTGTVQLVNDATYGNDLVIDFGVNSVFDLGDTGSINFGSLGGLEFSIPTPPIGQCRAFGAGTQNGYSVDMRNSGSIDMSTNNQINFTENNVFVLGSGTTIDGKMIIEGDGSVGFSVGNGSMTMGGVNVTAEGDVTVFADDSVELGDIEGDDITVFGNGSVDLGELNGDGNINITAGDDITIDEIGDADSIDIFLNSSAGGTIKIGNNETSSTSAFTVTCDTKENCNNFEISSDNNDSSKTECVEGEVNEPGVCGSGSFSFYLLYLLLLITIFNYLKSNISKSKKSNILK